MNGSLKIALALKRTIINKRLLTRREGESGYIEKLAEWRGLAAFRGVDEAEFEVVDVAKSGSLLDMAILGLLEGTSNETPVLAARFFLPFRVRRLINLTCSNMLFN